MADYFTVTRVRPGEIFRLLTRYESTYSILDAICKGRSLKELESVKFEQL